MRLLRRITQLLFLTFFLVLFIKARYPYETALASDVLLRSSPLLPLFYLLDVHTLSFFLWPALLILLLTPFIGRFFCGWICPLGTSLDLFSRMVEPTPGGREQRWQGLKWIKYGLLSALVLLAIFSINLWGYFDPLGIFTRIVTVIFHPLATLVADRGLMAGAQFPVVERLMSPAYDWFKEMVMPEPQTYLSNVATVMVLAVIVFGSEKLSRRFWCRNLCPAGALLGLLSQFRFYERIVLPACPGCNRCQTNCKMGAIPDGDVAKTEKTECIECFNCGQQCPPATPSIVFRLRSKPYRSRPDFSRRQFLHSAVAGAGTLGLMSIGLRPRIATARAIRPPGALPEEEFLDRCIRCLECVRICESNGRCLQPAGFQNRLEELWTPLAQMRDGYCEYNCNLCGEICPTDAILQLPLEKKQKLPMGLAYFDKNLCIPYVKHQDCIVCEEHCPTPDKAIKFEVKEVRPPDGKPRMVKYPYVVKELCIGCGVCEFKCPLPGTPAVFVNTEHQRRLSKIL